MPDSAKTAYLQILLYKKSKKLWTINTSIKLFQIKRLPKGMKNSSAIFQNILYKQSWRTYKALLSIKATFCFTHLRQMPWPKVCQHSFAVSMRKKLPSTKNVLNTTGLISWSWLLGHLLLFRGIELDPYIARNINFFQPSTVRFEHESFLGFVNFVGCMVPNFSRFLFTLFTAHERRWLHLVSRASVSLLRIASHHVNTTSPAPINLISLWLRCIKNNWRNSHSEWEACHVSFVCPYFSRTAYSNMERWKDRHCYVRSYVVCLEAQTTAI